MMPGEPYVLFLIRDSRPSTPVVAGVPAYHILGAWMGIFSVNGNTIHPSTNSPQELHALYEGMTLGAFETSIGKLVSANTPALP
jgi:hypothetical protein